MTRNEPSLNNLLARRVSRRQMLKGLVVLGGSIVAQRLVPAPLLPPRTRAATTPQQSALFSGERAMEHAAAQMAYIPRHPGTEGNRLCGDYILEQLAAVGWSTEEQPFTYRDTACRNVIGMRGSGPLLLLGAHYDTRRLADADPDPDNRSEPVPGANDGASGVAVLLELARVLDPAALGRTIWLTFFDAEDNGRLDGWQWIVGSQYMADNLTETVQGMVLVDMIGDASQQIYYEGNSHVELREGIWSVAADLGYATFIPSVRYTILDDHIPFKNKGIPAVDLIDFDYPYWHTVEDTLDKISAASLEAVGRTLQEWLLRDAPGLPPLADDAPTATPTVTPTVEAPTATPTVEAPTATPSVDEEVLVYLPLVGR